MLLRAPLVVLALLTTMAPQAAAEACPSDSALLTIEAGPGGTLYLSAFSLFLETNGVERLQSLPGSCTDGRSFAADERLLL